MKVHSIVCFKSLCLGRSGDTKLLFQAMNNFSGSSSFMPSCILCWRTRIFDKTRPDQESWNNCCWGNFNLSSTITTIITANTSKILFWSCITASFNEGSTASCHHDLVNLPEQNFHVLEIQLRKYGSEETWRRHSWSSDFADTVHRPDKFIRNKT